MRVDYEADTKDCTLAKQKTLEKRKGVAVILEEWNAWSEIKNRNYCHVWYVVTRDGVYLNATKGLKNAQRIADRARLRVKTGRLTDKERENREKMLREIQKLCHGSEDYLQFACDYMRMPRDKQKQVYRDVMSGKLTI